MSSGVYLVSSKPKDADETTKGNVYDNPGFTPPTKDASKDEVKFSNLNGVEMPADKTMPEKPYRGMGKEDLLYFSSRPFWRRLRMICIAIVALAWLALIITVVALVLVYPRCRDPAPRSWWQKEVAYRVYVPSFKDSDGDGIGDLKGIISKIDYLKDLGVKVLSLSPIYPTDGARDSDSAIINHEGIHSNYGTMEDFERLVQSAHDEDMYVILDFIPNHTSDQHPWFVSSRNTSDLSNAYRNYYVWENGDGANLPNNWVSVYGGPAWTAEPGRNQVYLHHFRSWLPDLNLRSSRVQEELADILKFWLMKGVDGFNIRDTSFLVEDSDLREDPKMAGDPDGVYSSFNHTFSQNRPEMYNLLADWRKVLDDQQLGEKLLMADTMYVNEIFRMYGERFGNGAQMPLNTRFRGNRDTCTSTCITSYVQDWQTMAGSGWDNWVVGDDETSRIASRFNSSYIRAFHMLSMLLPGTPVLYYGDEIGMEDGTFTPTAGLRKQRMRTPMQWENSTNAGFLNCTTGSCNPWIDVNDDVAKINVEEAQGDEGSLLNFIKKLIELRQAGSFQYGEYSTAVVDNTIFSFVTEFDGVSGHLVAINFGTETASRNYISASGKRVQEKSTVVLETGGDYAVDDEVDPSSITLGPNHGVVLSWEYVAKEL